VYKLIAGAFDALDRVLGAIGGAWRAAWGALWRGPIETLLFYLILTLTGAWILVEAAAEAIDDAVAWLEGAFITVAMLVMALLSFFDYARREIPGFPIDLEGGPNMAMVLMVWVGFLGASLATRQRKHLAVDASDRVLSPGAATFIKRFSALVAAGLCWILARTSWALTAEGLEFEDTLEGLKVWDGLVAPINTVIGLLPTAEANTGRLWLSVGAMFAAAWGARRLRGGAATWGAPILRAVAGLAGGVALLSALPLFWTPTLEFGDPVNWPTVEAGGRFPLWLAQGILPLSFLVMSARFLAAAIRGKFESAPLVEGADESTPAPPPAPRKPGDRNRKDVVLAGMFPGLLVGLGATLYFGKGGLILLAAILLVLVGAPLFVAVGVAALACVNLISGISGLSVVTDMFEACKKQELLAIPFFVLAGNLMTHGALADRLINIARAVMGKTPGGLGLATIFSCVFFAAISGSSPVTVIAIGTILFPMLVREGYPESYSLGVLTSAGSLGIIIPPSIPMILYAIMVSSPQNILSPNDLFIAGVLPGLFIAGMLMAYTFYRTRPGAPGAEKLKLFDMPEGYVKGLAQAVRKGALALVLPVLILGGIYGVLGPIKFTVTEAAAVAVVYALVVELLFHRELKPRDLPKILVDSGVMMGGLFLIIVLAIAFNKFLAHQMLPQAAAEWLASHVDAKWQFLILVNLFLLALGCVMEILSAILIVAPLLAPIAAQYGIDPIHFGIIFIVNLELGYLTPPLGINLFVASTVFERPIVQVIKASFPFLLLMLFCLAVIAWFPGLSLALLGE